MPTRIADTSGQDVVVQQRSSARKWMLLGVPLLGLAVLVLLAWPALSRWSQAEYSTSAERLRLATVERGEFIRDVSVQGRVVASIAPTLYAPATGTITFDVQSGALVESGQPLGTIDSPELDNRLQQEASSLERLKVDNERQMIEARQQRLENRKTIDLAMVALEAAQREQRRSEEAYARNAVSAIDHEKAQDDLRNAELAHQHAVADAELDNERLDFEVRTRQFEVERQQLLVADLQRQVDELIIRSPVDGIVGNLLVEQKTAVTQNQPVLSVVDLSAFEIEIQIPESYADDLALGMDAQVQFSQQVFPATLVSVSPEIIANQVTGRVRFTGDMPGGLRQNQRLTTRVLLDRKPDTLKVRRGQFLDSGSGRIAYVLGDGVAQRRSITTGGRSLSEVEVLDGLEEGDTIIISSTESFGGAETVLITD